MIDTGNVNGLTDVIRVTGGELDKPLVYVKLESETGGTMNGNKIDAKVDTNDYDDSVNEPSWADDGGFVPDEDYDDEVEEEVPCPGACCNPCDLGIGL